MYRSRPHFRTLLRTFWKLAASSSMTIWGFTSFAAAEGELSPLNRTLNLEPVLISGFIDSYYSYDFNEFEPRTRDYWTQSGRDREPNINLAYLDAQWTTESWRGRLAGQLGTSVDLNYAAEPGDAVRYIQEAYIGFRLAPKLWIDSGIYFSHIGFEGFISRDNWTYTRMMMSEYRPYYEEGVRLSYQYSDELSFQLHLLNGWQNISDFSDHHPSLGTQVAYQVKDGPLISDATFLGNEAEGTRFYNDLVAKVPVTPLLDVGASFDVGFQDRDAVHGGGNDQWYAWGVLSRLNFSDDFKIPLRVEQFLDHDNAIISTPNGEPFDVTSLSVGADVQLVPLLWWRTEYRPFFGKKRVFRGQDPLSLKHTDMFVVSSLSYSF